MNGASVALYENFGQVVDDALFVKVVILFACSLVRKLDPNAAVQETRDLKPLPNRLRVEVCLREYRWVGSEGNRGACSSNSDCPFLQFCCRFTLRELHFVLDPVASNDSDQLFGQSVYHRCTDTVEST